MDVGNLPENLSILFVILVPSTLPHTVSQSTKNGYVNISKLMFFPVNRTFLSINVPGIHSPNPLKKVRIAPMAPVMFA